MAGPRASGHASYIVPALYRNSNDRHTRSNPRRPDFVHPVRIGGVA